LQLLTVSVLLEYPFDRKVEDVLEKGHFPRIGSEDGPESLEILYELWVFAEEVYTVCIEDNQSALRQVPDEDGKEFVHVPISAQTRTNYPRINRTPPSHDPPQPLPMCCFQLFRRELHFCLRNEHWMDYDFWGVGLDGGGSALGAEDVGEVSARFEGGDGGIEGSAREL
jgi:hypothetical protein